MFQESSAEHELGQCCQTAMSNVCITVMICQVTRGESGSLVAECRSMMQFCREEI